MKKRTQHIKGKNFHEHKVNEQNMKLFIGMIFVFRNFEKFNGFLKFVFF